MQILELVTLNYLRIDLTSEDLTSVPQFFFIFLLLFSVLFKIWPYPIQLFSTGAVTDKAANVSLPQGERHVYSSTAKAPLTHLHQRWEVGQDWGHRHSLYNMVVNCEYHFIISQCPLIKMNRKQSTVKRPLGWGRGWRCNTANINYGDYSTKPGSSRKIAIILSHCRIHLSSMDFKLDPSIPDQPLILLKHFVYISH